MHRRSAVHVTPVPYNRPEPDDATTFMPPQKQKLYCYVDETGQDDASRVFVVVAVVSADDQERFREALTEIERAAGTGNRKWHKSRPERRLRYLELALERDIGLEDVFFGSYPKPLPYFFPFIEVLERAIAMKAGPSYTARVFVDGIDRKKAAELTNARCASAASRSKWSGAGAMRPSPPSAWPTCGRVASGRRRSEGGRKKAC
jgi:hypothetical protein